MEYMLKLLKDLFRHYISSNTFEKGAALSYYTVFSFIPITLIISNILGIVLKQEAISNEQNSILKNMVGEQGALQLEKIIDNQHLYHSNTIETFIGVGAMLLAASGMFNQIQRSITAIWRLEPNPSKSIFNYFVRYLFSLFFLMIVLFILLLSTTINSLLFKFSSNLPDSFTHVHLYENLISFFLITILFTLLFKVIGNANVHWKIAMLAAGFTSVLFFIGKAAIGLYIAKSSLNSTFGAASAIAILMIWVFYTSQILFIGASFAFVYGRHTGLDIKPK